MFLTYVNVVSPVHSCSARAKLLCLLLYSIVLVVFPFWPVLAGASLVLLAVVIVSRLSARMFIVPGILVYVIAVLSLLCNAFVWSSDLGITASLSGLERGCSLALRMCLLFWASLVVCYTTTSEQLINAFLWLLQPFQKVGLPIYDIATTFSIALRFMPLVAAEYEMVKRACWVRGGLANSRNPIVQLQGYAALFTPVVAGLIQRAHHLADAMESRCYGYRK